MAYKFPDEEDKPSDVEVKGAEEKDDIEIEVVDDTPEADRGSVALAEPVEDPGEEELTNYSEQVQNRIKKLTHARHDERRAKEAAMREKNELETFTRRLLEENATIKRLASNSNKIVQDQSIKAAEVELELARDNIRKAQEKFDTEAMISAQEALTDAKIKLGRVSSFSQTPLQPQETEVQTRQVQQPVAVKPDDKTLRWQAKNQWFGSDGFEEHTSFALGLHKKLVDSGIDPRSPEYFEKIDSRMHRTFPELFGKETSSNEQVSGTPRKPGSVVAPATRSTAVRRVQLTPTALVLAKRLGLTPQQYAAQVARLES